MIDTAVASARNLLSNGTLVAPGHAVLDNSNWVPGLLTQAGVAKLTDANTSKTVKTDQHFLLTWYPFESADTRK